MKSRQVIAATILVVGSIFFGLILSEAGSRLILNPADYVSPRMLRDPILSHTIVPNLSGYDSWGFRNKIVPTTADIVAIGDSHTYGNTATMEDAWPSVVARITGFSVYNLGLGGYGPNQYHHLLREKGIKLHPKWVICGLYMGDDFENAFSVTHGLDYWSFLREKRYDNVDPNVWNPDPPVWGASVRNWLSSHSVVYRLIFHGQLVAMLNEYVRFKHVLANDDPYTTALIAEDEGIREAFRPIGIAESLNQSSAFIHEGMRITFRLLNDMNTVCLQEGCRLLIVIIPTKETVFSQYIEKQQQMHLHDVLRRVIVNEQIAKKTLAEFLDDKGIAYVDTLPMLKRSVQNQLYAQTTRDMHPGKNGYRVIGEAVADYLKQFDRNSHLE